MKRALIQLIIPHEKIHARAHSLSHRALFFYATFILLIQLVLNFVSVKFPGVLGFASNIQVEEIIAQTNKFRQENNRPALKVNEKLSRSAQEKAAYMFEKNFWAHVAPDGTTPWKFILDSGYKYLYAGENLAKDFQNSGDVEAAWEASKIGHRENLLGPNYTDVGVAVVNGVLGGFETTLVVQMFGSETRPASEVSAAPASPAAPAPVAASRAGMSPTPVKVKGSLPKPTPLVLTPGVKPVVVAPPLEVAANRPLLPVVDVLALAKSVSYAFGFFLLALFLLDGFVVLRRNAVRISSHNAAHILVLLLILSSTFFLTTGSIR